MNSFKAVYRAMEYEAERLRKAAAEGRQPVQETRGWVEEKGKTVSQRSKEYAHDYRYFPEPDLPPLVLSRDWVEEIRAELPELPEARRNRFMAEYEEKFVKITGHSNLSLHERAKLGSNWLLGEVSRITNSNNIGIADFEKKVSTERLFKLTDLVVNGTITGTTAKPVLEEMFNTGKSADEIIKERGLSQISDTQELEEAISQVINDNPQPVADFKAGKEQALKFLVGQVMKATSGRANPKLVNELLKERLESE